MAVPRSLPDELQPSLAQLVFFQVGWLVFPPSGIKCQAMSLKQQGKARGAARCPGVVFSRDWPFVHAHGGCRP